MCWQCDNPDGDYISHLIDVIDERGWALAGVEASKDDPGWVHTVGLPARFGHPELLVEGFSTDAHQVLDRIARYLEKSGRTIRLGETMALGNRAYTFGALSTIRQRTDPIGSSIEVHRLLGISDVEVLEVIRVPEFEQCEHHFDRALGELLAEPPRR